MCRKHSLGIAVAMVLALTGSPEVEAQCVDEDFESFAVGTIVETEVDGLTFSVVGQSCGGSPTLYLRIADDFYGDSFTNRVLLIDAGCPDFSPDYLRMIFYNRQADVRFTLGPWAGTYQVNTYSTVSGGAPVASQSVTIPGTGFVDVHFPVQVARAERDIRRIEIEANADGFEAIDDLRFGADNTPPVIQIDSPAPLECISGEIDINGIVCDGDGAYDRDRLEYMRMWPDPQTAWTLVREFVGQEVCDPSPLYDWDTAEQGVIDGIYALRVTALNACGLATTEQVTVRVDNVFDQLELRSPAAGDIVGGAVCFDGTALDMACFDHYEVAYKPIAGGTWYPVDYAHSTYTSAVTDDILAWWTDAQGLADGDYLVVVAGSSATGATTNEQIAVTLDDTPPTAQIETPISGEVISGVVTITGTANDVNFYDWSLCFYDPSTQIWSYIDDDSGEVTNGFLAEWDTTGLDPGSYTLRLRVRDRAKVGCGIDVGPHVTEDYRAVTVSSGMIFSDGFEIGDTSGWSAATP
ncbi:MAG: hypothetical protein K8R59_00610 [Thermoanaerobaculales bacterium]|nr:hypothetical protein [Thermoanaerobaculales bacterium]